MQDSIGFSELKIAEDGFSPDKEDTKKTKKFKTKVEVCNWGLELTLLLWAMVILGLQNVDWTWKSRSTRFLPYWVHLFDVKCQFLKSLAANQWPTITSKLNSLFWTTYQGYNFAQMPVEELPRLVVEATPGPPAENVNVFKSPFYQETELLCLRIWKCSLYFKHIRCINVMFSVTWYVLWSWRHKTHFCESASLQKNFHANLMSTCWLSKTVHDNTTQHSPICF